MRVLIVEDDADVRTILSAFLQKANHEVCHAEDGEIALGQLERVAVDLIILDIKMPNLDGIGFLERLRQPENPHKDIPVILCSSVRQQDLLGQAVRLGIQGYILKPVKKDVFLQKVAEQEQRLFGQTSPETEAGVVFEDTVPPEPSESVNPFLRDRLDEQSATEDLEAVAGDIIPQLHAPEDRAELRSMVSKKTAEFRETILEELTQEIETTVSELKNSIQENPREKQTMGQHIEEISGELSQKMILRIAEFEKELAREIPEMRHSAHESEPDATGETSGFPDGSGVPDAAEGLAPDDTNGEGEPSLHTDLLEQISTEIYQIEKQISVELQQHLSSVFEEITPREPQTIDEHPAAPEESPDVITSDREDGERMTEPKSRQTTAAGEQQTLDFGEEFRIRHGRSRESEDDFGVHIVEEADSETLDNALIANDINEVIEQVKAIGKKIEKNYYKPFKRLIDQILAIADRIESDSLRQVTLDAESDLTEEVGAIWRHHLLKIHAELIKHLEQVSRSSS